MPDGMTSHERLVAPQKMHPRDNDAAGDLYQFGSEVDLDVGASSQFLVPLLDGQTLELLDCGMTITDAFAAGKLSGAIEFGAVFSDAADDVDYVVDGAQIASTAGGVGGAKGDAYSVLRGNGAQGASGVNFAWAAGMNTAAKRIFNPYGVAPGRTDVKILVLTVVIAASAAVDTAAKGVPFIRYRVYKAAMGE